MDDIIYSKIMEDIFTQLKEGRLFDKKIKPLSKSVYIKVLSFLEDNERFEDCHILLGMIEDRFSHELNFKLKKI